MSIVFQDWEIRASGDVLAYQNDNLSLYLLVTGPLPEGWNWTMLMEGGGKAWTVALRSMEGGMGAVLTASMLAAAGEYTLQLLGERMDNPAVARHTNTIQVNVSQSLSNEGEAPVVSGVTFYPSVSEEGVISWTNDGGLDNPEPVNIMGQPGGDGATYTPTVTEEGVLSWSNDKGLDNPAPVDIKGKPGGPGEPGEPGFSPVIAENPDNTEAVYRLDITDAEHTFTTPNLKGGGGGGGGEPGADGVTFTPSVSEEGVISWTNDGGLDNPEPVDLKGPPGRDGQNGAQGAPGTAATVEAGRVTVGTVPSVSNSGTESAAVLDFVLPIQTVTNAAVYSQEEQVIGTWVDGRPVYRSIEYIASLPSGAVNTTCFSFFNKAEYKILQFWGMGFNAPVPNISRTNVTSQRTWWPNDTTGITITGGAATPAETDVYVFLEYIKLTDEPTVAVASAEELAQAYNEGVQSA